MAFQPAILASVDAMKNHSFTRREFLKSAALASATLALPTIVPSTVLGRNAPSNRITMG